MRPHEHNHPTNSFDIAGPEPWRNRVGPKSTQESHESTSGTIAGKKISVEYGRPYKKGRKIFGGLEPLGKVWRTGADEATTFTTEADLMVGEIHVPAGTYSLFTIPDDGKWTLVLNKTAKQWGAFEYDQGQDLGRTPMKVSSVDSPPGAAHHIDRADIGQERHAQGCLGSNGSDRRYHGPLTGIIEETFR